MKTRRAEKVECAMGGEGRGEDVPTRALIERLGTDEEQVTAVIAVWKANGDVREIVLHPLPVLRSN